MYGEWLRHAYYLETTRNDVKEWNSTFRKFIWHQNMYDTSGDQVDVWCIREQQRTERKKQTFVETVALIMRCGLRWHGHVEHKCDVTWYAVTKPRMTWQDTMSAVNRLAWSWPHEFEDVNKVMVCFHIIALHPVQLYTSPLADLFVLAPTGFLRESIILTAQQLRVKTNHSHFHHYLKPGSARHSSDCNRTNDVAVCVATNS